MSPATIVRAGSWAIRDGRDLRGCIRRLPALSANSYPRLPDPTARRSLSMLPSSAGATGATVLSAPARRVEQGAWRDRGCCKQCRRKRAGSRQLHQCNGVRELRFLARGLEDQQPAPLKPAAPAWFPLRAKGCAPLANPPATSLPGVPSRHWPACQGIACNHH